MSTKITKISCFFCNKEFETDRTGHVVCPSCDGTSKLQEAVNNLKEVGFDETAKWVEEAIKSESLAAQRGNSLARECDDHIKRVQAEIGRRVLAESKVEKFRAALITIRDRCAEDPRKANGSVYMIASKALVENEK